MRDLLICGYYGEWNLGDEAMLAGLLALIRLAADGCTTTVTSGNPAHTTAHHGVATVERSMVQNAIDSHRCFLLGGGDLIRDSVQFSVADDWLRPLRDAVAKGRRTLVVGISVGEVWKLQTRQLVSECLNAVDFAAVRDEPSRHRLVELGVRRRIDLIGDVALEAVTAPAGRPEHRPHRPHIGLALRGLHGRGQSVDTSRYGELQQCLAEAANRLVTEFGAHLDFIPFRTIPDRYHPFDDDFVAASQVCKRVQPGTHLTVHRHVSGLRGLIALLEGLDLLIGMRLHSLVIAAALGVPVIAIEYDPKVRGFMESIGQANRSIPLHEVSADRILSLADTTLETQVAIREQLRDAVRALRNQTERIVPALRELLTFEGHES